MDDESQNTGGNRRRRQPSVSRRVWNEAEEKALIHALKQIVAEGWKCENGFRAGYQVKLHKLMLKTIPHTTLKPEPHIGSKISTWKKTHGSVQCMLSRSGFAWVEGDKTVSVHNDQVWDEYIATDAWAKKMKLRGKSFPYYNDWCEVFGKDRATGEFAEDMTAADTTPLGVDEEENDVSMFDHSMGENNGMNSPAAGSEATSSKNKRTRKNKSVENNGDQLVGLMGKFCDQTNDRLGDIASKIGYELHMSSKRESLFLALGELGVLTMDDQIAVARVLVNNNMELELFFSLPPTARARMVLSIVQSNI